MNEITTFCCCCCCCCAYTQKYLSACMSVSMNVCDRTTQCEVWRGSVHPVLSQNQKRRAGWRPGTSVQQSVICSEGLRTTLKIHCSRLQRHTATIATQGVTDWLMEKTSESESDSTAKMMWVVSLCVHERTKEQWSDERMWVSHTASLWGDV